jgi:flagellar FliL protein
MSENTEKKKKKGINPLLIIIIVLVLAIVGLAAYFLVFNKTSQQGPYVPKPIVQTSWSAGDFLVNLADTDQDKYLKTTIYLTYDETDKTLGTDMDAEKYAIRDSIIAVIRSKKSSELNDKGIDLLRQDIIKKVNAYLGGNKIISVYYNDILIQ